MMAYQALADLELGFNPRPPLLAGDVTDDERVRMLREFQSAPAIAGGRCLVGQLVEVAE